MSIFFQGRWNTAKFVCCMKTRSSMDKFHNLFTETNTDKKLNIFLSDVVIVVDVVVYTVLC